MKNKKRKRIFGMKLMCSLLAIVMCALCFISCKKDKTDQPIATTPANTTTGTQVESIKLISEGKANVRIVYQTTGGAFLTEAASTLKNALSELGGVEISVVADILSEEKAEDLEIVIGGTEYAVSKEAMGALTPNSYSVTVSGNKIVVVANNIYLYSIAVDELVNAISAADGTVMLAGDFSKKSESYPVVSLAADNNSDYTIVYANGDEEAHSQAIVLKSALLAAGVNVPISDDTKSASGKEILIGATNRELSKNSKAYYFNAYTDSDENGNLAITGKLEPGIESIVECVENLSLAGSSIDIPCFLFGRFHALEGYGNAPKYEGSGEVKLWENHEKFYSYYIQASNATKKDYKDYEKKLIDAGFELYSSNEVQYSLFSTYTDGYNIVNLCYIEYIAPLKGNEPEHYINIAIECTDNFTLPPLEDNGEKITEIQVTQIETGCAFLIRLEDGRFIIYDGGTEGTNNSTAIAFYEQLVAQNVREGKPVVAAWFISHHHGDHLAGPIQMMKMYPGQVEIQTIVTNTPGQEVCAGITDNVMYEDRWINTLYSNVQSHFPGTKYIMAHAGQRFEFSGLTVDVLYTPENYYGSKMFLGNQEVCVYSFDMTNGRIIFTGDAQPQNCQMIAAIYGEELEADVVQYAHHGYAGGDVTFYDIINAKYGIWTTSYQSNATPRPNYNGVDPNSDTISLMPWNTEQALIFKHGMTKDDLAKYIREW